MIVKIKLEDEVTHHSNEILFSLEGFKDLASKPDGHLLNLVSAMQYNIENLSLNKTKSYEYIHEEPVRQGLSHLLFKIISQEDKTRDNDLAI